MRVREFAVYTTFTFQRTVTNAQGNEVDTDKVTVTATPNVGLRFYSHSGYLSGKCASDPLYTATDEKNWLRSWIKEEYLWYNEVVDHGTTIGDYSIETYFDLMKTFAEAASCGQSKDRFRSIQSMSSESDTSDRLEASDAGIGVVFGRTSSSRIYVDSVYANSPAASVTLTNNTGETVATGLMRGDRVIEVDGRRVDFSSLEQVLEVLNRFSTSETHVLKIVRTGMTDTLTASITTARYGINPVPQHRVVDTRTGNVGYLRFDKHINEAEQKLSEAIESFNTGQGIVDLVLDLRNNGGGGLDIANSLATMIATPSRTAGQTFERLIFNGKRSAYSRQVNELYELFNPSRNHSSQNDETTPTRELPNLNLERVFVLTSHRTCSASEAIINGLRGVDVEVIQIGTTTCGKPYRSIRTENCGTTYKIIEAIGVNAKGFGDYQHGFAPEGVSNPRKVIKELPGCWVDHFDINNQLGDMNEPLLAAALAYRSNDDNSCTASTSRRSRNATEVRETYELTSRKFPPWGDGIIE